MDWEKIKNLNTVLQIILGVVILGTTVGISNEVILNGFNSKIPIWISIIILFSSFIFGYLICNRKLKRKTRHFSRKEIKLKFNSLPEKLGWNLVIDSKNGENKPLVEIGRDGLYGHYLQIEQKDSYYLDYYFPIQNELLHELTFIIQNNKKYNIYAKVKLKSKNNELDKDGWIDIKEGDLDPSPFDTGKYEWKYYAHPEKVENYWKEFKINLPLAVKQSFGIDGWVFSCITGIRIRGSIKIAEIKVK
jgi:hypothetical protein